MPRVKQHDFMQLPGISELEGNILERVLHACQVIDIDAGEIIFADHAACHDFILILQGIVTVQKITEDGHHLTLHHLYPGETCGLTASCLLGHGHQPANLLADTPVRALLLSHPGFDLLMTHSETFSGFVHQAIDHDLKQIIHLVEDVTTLPVEQRLARVLLQHLQAIGIDEPILAITHQTLSEELGSAREVVSRNLKRFEQRGWICLHRGQIEILDASALGRLARLSRDADPKSE